MTDPSDQTAAASIEGSAAETPAQKALRLKNAKLDARPKPPRGGRFQRDQAAGVSPGANRPWTHK